MGSMALEEQGEGRIIRTDGERGSDAPGMGTMGITLFLASLTMLFAGSLVAVVWVRISADQWPPAGAPALPRLLWLSTALLIGCSATIHSALGAIRRGDQQGLQRRLILTAVLATLFLSSQAVGWFRFFDAAVFESHLYSFSFYVLTGLHAAHVIGGIVAMAVVLVMAYRGCYSCVHYPGVRNTAIYWHFLDAVWLVLFAFLLATG
jgi:cytochrome c oxidase subunit 3